MNKETIINELTFKAIRSSGAGGQHVNKVSSKVVLSFDLSQSEGFSDRESSLLYKSLSSRLTSSGILSISCDESKSQFQNKDKVIKRFLEIIAKGLIVQKRRIATKPSKGSKRRKLDAKKQRGQTKNLRKKPKLDS
jgi:ribosome-associated protein|tara:strand:- start:743 stop:1150 length:408 start_codon:yes stop_codon:yes gene_type:complete